MLYNESTGKLRTATAPRFVRWLEKKPAAKYYDYVNPLNCPYAQYLRSYGVLAMVSPLCWIGLWLGIVPVAWRVPPKTDRLLAARPHTFGGAVARAKAIA